MPTTTKTTSSLDAALAKIDQYLAAAEPGVRQMSPEQFQEYTAAEIEKALAEAAGGKEELSKARLEHLKAQIAAAKAVYDEGATLAPITFFKDPWQTLPGESAVKGEANVPQPAITPTGESNIEFKEDVVFVQTEKGGRELSPLMKALIFVAKASEKSPLRQKLSKAEGGPEIIQKAGEAQNILSGIATMFGVAVDEPADLLDYDFRWSVADTIKVLQSAAKLEGVMQQMSGMLSAAVAAAAKSEGSAPAESATVSKSSDAGPAWPLDMANVSFDEKAGVLKGAEDDKLYWGRDSEKAPTT